MLPVGENVPRFVKEIALFSGCLSAAATAPLPAFLNSSVSQFLNSLEPAGDGAEVGFVVGAEAGPEAGLFEEHDKQVG